MRTARLGDICDIVSGGTPSRSNPEFWQDGTIPWIKIGNIKGKYISEADEYVTRKGLDGSSAKMLPKGTILYTIFATLGEVGILNINACTNQAIAGITIRDSSEVQTDYLYYYLKSKKNYVNEIGRGVAQNNINMSILRNFSVPLPKIEEQKEIVYVLVKAETIIAARKQQLSALDDLIKARFVEMFGECLERKRLEEFTSLITKGASPKWQGIEYCDEGTLFVTSENVREGFVDLSKRKYLPDDINKILPRSVLRRNDILINIVGASIGRAAVYESDELANINQAVALVRLIPHAINIVFLLMFLNGEEAQKEYIAMKKGGARDNLSLKNIADLQIPVAKVEQQDEFAAFVAQVDKSKAAIQKSLDKTQTLFDSLMQQYFG